ncbi:DMT family transporter [Thermovenabulum sp.]|uniref:DMT family transporter n=1 Tax=Thermovenabulum sp. TaxID=3100335 RepID=UPI003C7D40C4
MKKSLLADGALLLVTMGWGLNFVVMKNVFLKLTPFMYLAVRFLIAFLILSGIFNENLCNFSKEDIKGGLLAGLFLFFGFASQAVGLLYTTPAKSGFITGSSVVMVPFFAYFVTKKFPGWSQVTGALLAFLGLAVISVEGNLKINLGDLITVFCAVFFALQIVIIEYYARIAGSVNLAILETGIAGILSLITGAIYEPMPAKLDIMSWAAILYASIFCTAGAFVIQNIAQKYTTSTHAAVIMCMESVFAGIFSYIFWHEPITLKTLSGFFLILTGVLITELLPSGKMKKADLPG